MEVWRELTISSSHDARSNDEMKTRYNWIFRAESGRAFDHWAAIEEMTLERYFRWDRPENRAPSENVNEFCSQYVADILESGQYRHETTNKKNNEIQLIIRYELTIWRHVQGLSSIRIALESREDLEQSRKETSSSSHHWEMKLDSIVDSNWQKQKLMEVDGRLTLTVSFGEMIQIFLGIKFGSKIFCVQWSTGSIIETRPKNELWCKNFTTSKELSRLFLELRRLMNPSYTAWILFESITLLKHWWGMVEIKAKLKRWRFAWAMTRDSNLPKRREIIFLSTFSWDKGLKR